jgi:hypothetical protein
MATVELEEYAGNSSCMKAANTENTASMGLDSFRVFFLFLSLSPTLLLILLPLWLKHTFAPKKNGQKGGGIGTLNVQTGKQRWKEGEKVSSCRTWGVFCVLCVVFLGAGKRMV